MKPPIPYFGGKQMLADRIIATFPEHDHYVEPFAGSLAVLLAKRPSKFETVNDLDGDLVNFWRVLRDQPEDLERACALTPHSRAELMASREIPDDVSDVERARRVYVHLTQGRSGIRTSTGWRYNVEGGSTASMARYMAGYAARIAPAAARLARVTLECRPALEVIAEYGQHPSTLLYVDPPYLASIRRPGAYVVEMGSDDEHRELAAALHACKAAVVLSGYASPLYGELYADWHPATFDVLNTQADVPDGRQEVLWLNRASKGPDLFDLLEDGAA